MILSSASFSPDRVYRYSLMRRWKHTGNRFVVIGLNPSTADETADDPTIRRCIGFAKREGCAEYVMLNLFGFRATDPAVMKRQHDPIGPQNDSLILNTCVVPSWHPKPVIVAAWGVHGAWRNRGEQVVTMLTRQGVDLYHFGLTKDNHPKHPLYLAASTPLTRWTVA